MDVNKLYKKLEKYGGDMKGINGRFMDDREFYGECFHDFLVDPSFAELDAAVKSGDWERSFNAAHALKGISANLGLTPFYEAICVLVESLREGQRDKVADVYDAVRKQRRRLEDMNK